MPKPKELYVSWFKGLPASYQASQYAPVFIANAYDRVDSPFNFATKPPAMNMKEVAMRVQQLRMDRHLVQKEVAAVLGISQPAYSDKENGHTAFTAVELDKLAEFHGKTLDELLHADRAVMHMNDHSTHGFNAYHMEHRHRASEELIKQFLETLAANTHVLERISAQQERVLELLSKR